jgi:hypothetical protein
MNRQDINLLQKLRSYPSITITVPTHRNTPENKQDPVNVKNLISETIERLLTEFSKKEMEPIITRLEDASNQIDFRNTLDGLAIFVNRDFSRIVYLPFTLKKRVVIDETFMTRDLVFAMNRSPRYRVLVLSEKPTRLFEAVRDNIEEITDEKFPLTHTGPGGEKALPGGFGKRKSAYRDERHEQYFRAIDDALKTIMLDDPLPLVVVGVDRFLSFFRKVTDHEKFILATVTGSHDKTTVHELRKLVWPVVEEKLKEKRLYVFEELQNAKNQEKAVSTIGEVWRMAKEGRGRLLLVEEDYHFPARIDNEGHLFPADNNSEAQLLEDAVDDVIEIVLSKQGEVVFVENGTLKEDQRIALILRY